MFIIDIQDIDPAKLAKTHIGEEIIANRIYT